jgi:hypothetical protein
MRLRNPGGLEQAIATVRQVKGELMNTVAGDSARRKADFLAWFDYWATPQLGNHFPRSEGIFAEIAESYHRLVLAPPMSVRELNGLLHREWQEWDARLERVLSELEELSVFLQRQGDLVVLDTSALMEGVFFTDYDWHKLDASLAGGPVRPGRWLRRSPVALSQPSRLMRFGTPGGLGAGPQGGLPDTCGGRLTPGGWAGSPVGWATPDWPATRRGSGDAGGPVAGPGRSGSASAPSAGGLSVRGGDDRGNSALLVR